MNSQNVPEISNSSQNSDTQTSVLNENAYDIVKHYSNSSSGKPMRSSSVKRQSSLLQEIISEKTFPVYDWF